MGAQCGNAGRGPPDPSQPRPPGELRPPIPAECPDRERKPSSAGEDDGDVIWAVQGATRLRDVPSRKLKRLRFHSHPAGAPLRCHDLVPSGRHRLHAHPRSRVQKAAPQRRPGPHDVGRWQFTGALRWRPSPADKHTACMLTSTSVPTCCGARMSERQRPPIKSAAHLLWSRKRVTH